MTQTGPASSLALLVPVVSTRCGLSDGSHSRKEPLDVAPSLEPSLASANRGRFGALRGCGGIWVRWRHEFAGGIICVRGIYAEYTLCRVRIWKISANPSKSEDNTIFAVSGMLQVWQNTGFPLS
ncbi:uncharacterized protein PITG_23130 [Phytophthora infestans T30-4]|uniref:Uncharacterized protein n=1 Tax=Phytophthora infestans (strain T30-4) TaxID=403677 RepID=D0NYG0_PHYIT|nr:uncharacterized protein PITG_23130 [Phytophthora infestans T30-4]EEY68072.1 conserved hypothetical protein [Phytophthora infestans T30-4]|eukprot:XP_002997630.1 conserved hypothetical protein [Phytophthora infestans T30-4]